MYMQSAPQAKQLGQYTIFYNQLLGRGGYGSVYNCCRNKQVENLFAIKIVPIPKNTYKQLNYQKCRLKDLKRQLQILQRFRHENIVRLIQIWHNQNNVYMIFEKCQTSLETYLSKQPFKRVSQQHAIEIMIQILKGYHSMIACNIVHRDLKPANILIKDGKFKIADFGVSRRISQSSLLSSVCGTFRYSAPEAMDRKDKSLYSNKCDIFSLGCIFYEMLNGIQPFQNEKRRKQVIQTGVEFVGGLNISQEVKKFIRSCIRKESERPDWIEVYNNPIFGNKLPNLQGFNLTLIRIITTFRRQAVKYKYNFKKLFGKNKGQIIPNKINLQKYQEMITQLIPDEDFTQEDIVQSFNYFDNNRDNIIEQEQIIRVLQSQQISEKNIQQMGKQYQLIYNLLFPSRAENISQKEPKSALQVLDKWMNNIKEIYENNVKGYFQWMLYLQKNYVQKCQITSKQFHTFIQFFFLDQVPFQQAQLIHKMFDTYTNTNTNSIQQFLFHIKICNIWGKQS